LKKSWIVSWNGESFEESEHNNATLVDRAADVNTGVRATYRAILSYASLTICEWRGTVTSMLVKWKFEELVDLGEPLLIELIYTTLARDIYVDSALLIQ
jgi:hypothetical protein